MSPTEYEDAELWITECLDCKWQGYDRDQWRASDKADAHFNETGHHLYALVSEDR